MMLTRSFIQSYLLISSQQNEHILLQCIEEGLNTINSRGFLSVSVPSENEKKRLRMRINYDDANLSFYDYIHQEFETQNVPQFLQNRLYETVKLMTEEDLHYDKVPIPDLITDLYQKMK
jgi:hypothetical protein